MDVDSDTMPAWMPAFSEMLDRKLDTKLDGFDPKIDQVLGLHQTLLDKHDGELESHRQLLENLKTEVSLLRKSSFDTGKMSCDTSSVTPSTVGSASQSGWCPQNVLVRGWAPLSSRPSSKIDRIEYKKLYEDLLCLLPTGLQNKVVVRAPFAANHQISLWIKGGGWDMCREVSNALIAGIDHHRLQVRGEPLEVAVELSPRRKITPTCSKQSPS